MSVSGGGLCTVCHKIVSKCYVETVNHNVHPTPLAMLQAIFEMLGIWPPMDDK